MAESSPAPAAGLRAVVFALLVVVVAARVVVPALSADKFGVATLGEAGGWSSDYAGIVVYAKALWAGEAGYDLESHLRVTSAYLGFRVEHALPFGYPPNLMWVLAPFCLLPLAWGFCLWTALELAAIAWMAAPRWALWVGAAFFSPLAMSCFQLGQTAILTTAGLTFLVLSDSAARGDVPRTEPRDWLDGLVLWALAAKPPLAITGAAAMLAAGRYRPVAIALVATLVSLLLLAPILGFDWVPHYLSLVSSYDVETANPAFAQALVPETMANFRALLSVVGGADDALAARVSSFVWLAVLGLLVGLAHWRPLAATTRWGVAALAYLLFCPHVTSTELLLLTLVVRFYVDPAHRVSPGARLAVVALTFFVLFTPPSWVIELPARIPIAFAIQLAIAGIVIRTGWRQAGADL